MFTDMREKQQKMGMFINNRMKLSTKTGFSRAITCMAKKSV